MTTILNALRACVTASDDEWANRIATELEAAGRTADDVEWLATRAQQTSRGSPRGLLKKWLDSGDWRCELRYRVLDKPAGDPSILPELDDRAWRASYQVVFEGRTVGDAGGIVGIDVAQVEDSIKQLAPNMRGMPCGHWSVPQDGKKQKCYRCAEARR